MIKSKMKKRKPSEKQMNAWKWTKVWTTPACIRYHKWSHKPHIQKKIYIDNIERPLTTLIVSMLNKYNSKGDWQNLFQRYKNPRDSWEFLINDSKGYFFTNILPKYQTEETYPRDGFNYVYTAIHNYLMNVNIGLSERKSDMTFHIDGELSTDDRDTSFYRQTPKKELLELNQFTKGDIKVDEVEYMNLVINYWEENITDMWRSELKKKIASNMVELFKSSHQIKYFRQKSMYRYLRTMMGWDKESSKLTGNNLRAFKDVLSKFRKKHKLFRRQFKSCGQIDFFTL